MGAKSQLAAQLVQWFPPCHTYVEPFFATGKVLFSKPRRDKVEIVNDYESDLIVFWQWVQNNPQLLVETINSIPTHEAVVWGLRDSLARHELHGVQRAAAWYVGSQSAYNSKGKYNSYGCTVYQLLDLSIDLAKVQKCFARLQKVSLRSRDFSFIIEQTNKDLSGYTPAGGVFYYLDPPYWGTEDYRGMDLSMSFPWAKQVELAQRCAQIDEMGNKLIQTNSAHPDLAKLYGGFKRDDGSSRFEITTRDVKYTMGGGQGDLFQEFIISNFPLRERKKQQGLFGV